MSCQSVLLKDPQTERLSVMILLHVNKCSLQSLELYLGHEMLRFELPHFYLTLPQSSPPFNGLLPAPSCVSCMPPHKYERVKLTVMSLWASHVNM